MSTANGTNAYGGRAKVWTYRSHAVYARDETEALTLLRHQAERYAGDATVTLLSVRRTPTGRYSAMVLCERVPGGEA